MQKVTMASRLAELSLLLLLGIVSWSRVEAGDIVTVNSLQTTVEDGNSVLGSLSNDVSDDQITVSMNVKRACPGVAQMDINIYKAGVLTNTVTQTYKQPLKEIINSNLCGSIDAPEPDDDSCSVQEGDQSISQCDVKSLFSGMDDDEYEAVADITIEGEKIGTMILGVTVSS